MLGRIYRNDFSRCKARYRQNHCYTHYQRKLYENTAVIDRYTILAAKAAELGIELLLGSELCANEDLIVHVRKMSRKSKLTAQYLLMEIPSTLLQKAIKMLNRIKRYQAKIVIAHPELIYY